MPAEPNSLEDLRDTVEAQYVLINALVSLLVETDVITPEQLERRIEAQTQERAQAKHAAALNRLANRLLRGD